MGKPKNRKLRVAAVQMNCIPGEVDANLKRAEEMVLETVEQGAELVLLPELMPSGYFATEEIWDFAETIQGESVTWLKRLAKQHGIYLGFSFMEAEGEDFYNSFVLASPKGEIDGRVRKNPPASIEAHFYKGGDDLHVIETNIGRFGVSICYENLLYDNICELDSLSVDMVLSPFAAGRPKPFIPGDIRRYEDMLKNVHFLHAETLGVPNVMANRIGPLETELPGWLPYLKSSFPGLSAITDSDGTIMAELDEQEAVIVANVTLDPARKKKDKTVRHGKIWALPVPWYAFLWPMTQKPGEKEYPKNPRRKKKAITISQGSENKLLDQ